MASNPEHLDYTGLAKKKTRTIVDLIKEKINGMRSGATIRTFWEKKNYQIFVLSHINLMDYTWIFPCRKLKLECRKQFSPFFSGIWRKLPQELLGYLPRAEPRNAPGRGAAGTRYTQPNSQLSSKINSHDCSFACTVYGNLLFVPSHVLFKVTFLKVHMQQAQVFFIQYIILAC